MFDNAKSSNEVEPLQKRALYFLYDNYDSSYQSILEFAGKSTMNVTKIRSLCIELFKTLKDINPTFMSSGRLNG